MFTFNLAYTHSNHYKYASYSMQQLENGIQLVTKLQRLVPEWSNRLCRSCKQNAVTQDHVVVTGQVRISHGLGKGSKEHLLLTVCPSNLVMRFMYCVGVLIRKYKHWAYT